MNLLKHYVPWFAFLACLGGGCFLVYSSIVDPIRASERLTISPLKAELGDIPPEKHQVEFTLANTSPQTIRIHSIGKSCDCTQAKIKNHLLKPGEKTLIEAEWDTTGKIGNSNSSLTVNYFLLNEDSESKPEDLQNNNRLIATLMMSGNVIADFSYHPKKLEFQLGKTSSRQIKLASKTTSFLITEASIDHPAFETSIVSSPNVIVEVKFDSTRWLDQSSSVNLIMRTNDEKVPLFKIPVVLSL